MGDSYLRMGCCHLHSGLLNHTNKNKDKNPHEEKRGCQGTLEDMMTCRNGVKMRNEEEIPTPGMVSVSTTTTTTTLASA